MTAAGRKAFLGIQRGIREGEADLKHIAARLERHLTDADVLLAECRKSKVQTGAAALQFAAGQTLLSANAAGKSMMALIQEQKSLRGKADYLAPELEQEVQQWFSDRLPHLIGVSETLARLQQTGNRIGEAYGEAARHVAGLADPAPPAPTLN